MPEVFITRRIFTEAKDKLTEAGIDYESNDTGEILTRRQLIENARDKDGLLCLLNDEIDDELLSSCPNLRIVANISVGTTTWTYPRQTSTE